MIPRAAIDFLAELGANNEKAWFEPRKEEYRRLLREPLRDLVAVLAPAMLDIDPAFDVDPRGGAISRIHRDTRFSRDKSPYRVNQWITFKIKGEGWTERPAFFMEIGPAGWRYGLGFYAASPATMTAVRARILARLPEFRRAIPPGFALEGEEYARPKVPDGLPPEAAEWWRRKNAYYVVNRTVDDGLTEVDMPKVLVAAFTSAAPMYSFLKSAAP
jgi:uncharacterized protein (TIGR02453 family)